MELIDGILYTMGVTNNKYQGTVLGILFQIKMCLEQHKTKCRVFMVSSDVQLNQDIYTMVQPDIIVFCGDESFRNAVYFGAPHFVVEVLSKNSRRYDYSESWINTKCRRKRILDRRSGERKDPGKCFEEYVFQSI